MFEEAGCQVGNGIRRNKHPWHVHFVELSSKSESNFVS